MDQVRSLHFTETHINLIFNFNAAGTRTSQTAQLCTVKCAYRLLCGWMIANHFADFRNHFLLVLVYPTMPTSTWRLRAHLM